MAAGSDLIRDILITYNIVGDEKLRALRALSDKVKLSVVADNRIVIGGLSAAFTGPTPLTVLVECNTGADRCGVASPEDAAELAAAIATSPGLEFGGLMTYPPTGGVANVQAFMFRAKTLIEEMGLTVPCVSSGGTPDMMSAHTAPTRPNTVREPMSTTTVRWCREERAAGAIAL